MGKSYDPVQVGALLAAQALILISAVFAAGVVFGWWG